MAEASEHQREDPQAAAHFAAERRAMVDEQLLRRGISNRAILAAMLHVPRELFVPRGDSDNAYADGALAIGHGQTISQPYTVAFMCEAAELEMSDRVLEIGTGCGYSAAVLAQLAAHVDSIERIAELSTAARVNLARLSCTNITLHVGDGTLGLPQAAPFDAIVVTAGSTELPTAYRQQLCDGGRIIIPIGPSHHSQIMYRITRRGDQLQQEALGSFAFVPLIGGGPAAPLAP